MKGLVTHKIPDPDWGFPTIARAIPNDDHPWGALRFFVDTPWEPLFPRITFNVLDQALRGYATPLMKVLGPPPRAFVKRLPTAHAQCAQRASCVSYSPLCVPGPKVPDCWEPSMFTGPDVSIVNNVVRLWRDDIIVIVAIPKDE